jgi:hypothetical protein
MLSIPLSKPAGNASQYSNPRTFCQANGAGRADERHAIPHCHC